MEKMIETPVTQTPSIRVSKWQHCPSQKNITGVAVTGCSLQLPNEIKKEQGIFRKVLLKGFISKEANRLFLGKSCHYLRK
jgi:hypothetical protein